MELPKNEKELAALLAEHRRMMEGEFELQNNIEGMNKAEVSAATERKLLGLTTEAVDTLEELMKHSSSHETRRKCAVYILDNGLGKFRGKGENNLDDVLSKILSGEK